MQRVKTAFAVESKPPYDPTGTPGYFTSGNPLTAQQPTVPGKDWFNMTQEELIAVILAAGLELDPQDDTQLNQAIDAKIQAAAVRLAPDGGIIDTEDGLAVDPSVIDATAQLRYHGLI